MHDVRTVVVTIPMVESLTMLELARAARVTGVRLTDTERCLRAMMDPAADPEAFELGSELLYAWSWQLVRRDEPGTTWEDAQRWRVTFDLDARDPIAADETRARVEAAILTGLPPEDAERLTLGELAAYRQAGASIDRQVAELLERGS